MASDPESLFDTSSRPDSAYMMTGKSKDDVYGKAPSALPSSQGPEANPLFESGELALQAEQKPMITCFTCSQPDLCNPAP